MPSVDISLDPPPTAHDHDQASFLSPNLFGWLEAADGDALDALEFGLIAMGLDGKVEHYSKAESELANLSPDKVVGRHFFTAVAPCTNNVIVAYRFETESEIDAVINYTFTFRIAPMAVRLRLLKRPGGRRMYLAVEKAG
jgi:photoactive yellow protein